MGPRGCPNGFGSLCSETEILARVGDTLHVKQMSHAIALAHRCVLCILQAPKTCHEYSLSLYMLSVDAMICRPLVRFYDSMPIVETQRALTLRPLWKVFSAYRMSK